jgi:hypothetical protein
MMGQSGQFKFEAVDASVLKEAADNDVQSARVLPDDGDGAPAHDPGEASLALPISEPPVSASPISISPLSVSPISDASGANARENLAKRTKIAVEVHDGSRFEWSVNLPIACRDTQSYAIEVDFDLPAHLYVPHDPWEHFQCFGRFGEAIESGAGAETIDALRRETLGIVSKLSRVHDHAVRGLRARGSLVTTGDTPLDGEEVDRLVEKGTRLVAEARRELSRSRSSESVAICTERRLVDEYISVRYLEFLSGIRRSIQACVAGEDERPRATSGALPSEACVRRHLVLELKHRAVMGYVSTQADPQTVERFVERSSHLKKHFQEVLFLEHKTYHVAERIHHIVAAFVAVLASTWAFVWQIALADRAMSSSGGRIGSGVIMIGAVFGLVYAAKDRIKEVGRHWINGRVHRLYAQRVSRFLLPEKLRALVLSKSAIVTVRESFGKIDLTELDPLNPESGARQKIVRMTYQHRGRLDVNFDPRFEKGRPRGLKFVFRQDLSPIFPRLDDANREVPMLLGDDVCFVEAPRAYRLGVCVKVTRGPLLEPIERRGHLIMHKRGLVRWES